MAHHKLTLNYLAESLRRRGNSALVWGVPFCPFVVLIESLVSESVLETGSPAVDLSRPAAAQFAKQPPRRTLEHAERFFALMQNFVHEDGVAHGNGVLGPH